MTRFLAVFVLTNVFLAQATGITLAVHLHECDCDHDAHQCPTCHLLIGGVLVPPTQPDHVSPEPPACERGGRPAESPRIERPNVGPGCPRAPPPW